MSIYQKRKAMEMDYPNLSISYQFLLLGIHRLDFYYSPKGKSPLNLKCMSIIQKEFFDIHFYGVHKMTHLLRHLGFPINCKSMCRLYLWMSCDAMKSWKILFKYQSNREIFKTDQLIQFVSLAYSNTLKRNEFKSQWM